MAEGKAIVLELGGKNRRPFYNLNAVCEVEERIGLKLHHVVGNRDWMEKLADLDVGMAHAIRTIVWAALVHEDKELTEEQVGEWVSLDNWQEVVEGFFELFAGTGAGLKEQFQAEMAKSMEEEEEEPTPPTKVSASKGSSS